MYCFHFGAIAGHHRVSSIDPLKDTAIDIDRMGIALLL